MHLHFLRAIGTAMSMRAGIAADTSAALLFRILSQPTLLFPPLRHAEGVELHHEPLGGYVSSYKRQVCSVSCTYLLPILYLMYSISFLSVFSKYMLIGLSLNGYIIQTLF